MFATQQAKAVAVATTDEVLRISTSDATHVSFEIKNTGANALDALEVWGKVNNVSNDQKLLFNGTDFTTPVYPCIRASASPVALAAGTSVWMVIDATAFDSIGIRASSAVGTTTLDLFANAKRVK